MRAIGTPSGAERGIVPTRPYELVRKINGSIERFIPGIADDGVWAVEIDGHLVDPEASETNQLCLRAIAQHHQDSDMPVLEACFSAVLLTFGKSDEPGPLTCKTSNRWPLLRPTSPEWAAL